MRAPRQSHQVVKHTYQFSVVSFQLPEQDNVNWPIGSGACDVLKAAAPLAISDNCKLTTGN